MPLYGQDSGHSNFSLAIFSSAPHSLPSWTVHYNVLLYQLGKMWWVELKVAELILALSGQSLAHIRAWLAKISSIYDMGAFIQILPVGGNASHYLMVIRFNSRPWGLEVLLLLSSKVSTILFGVPYQKPKWCPVGIKSSLEYIHNSANTPPSWEDCSSYSPSWLQELPSLIYIPPDGFQSLRGMPSCIPVIGELK